MATLLTNVVHASFLILVFSSTMHEMKWPASLRHLSLHTFRDSGVVQVVRALDVGDAGDPFVLGDVQLEVVHYLKRRTEKFRYGTKNKDKTGRGLCAVPGGSRPIQPYRRLQKQQTDYMSHPLTMIYWLIDWLID